MKSLEIEAFWIKEKNFQNQGNCIKVCNNYIIQKNC